MTADPGETGRGGPSVGLPEGVLLAPLGRRAAAFVVDAFVPYLITVLVAVLFAAGVPGWVGVLLLLPVAWLVLQWWLIAVRGAGVGMRLMRLQVVGLQDGRPLGWTRALIRGVVLVLFGSSLVLLAVMVVLMLRQIRRQGWHDLAADAVVIEERVADTADHGSAAADDRSLPPVPTVAATPTAPTAGPGWAQPALDPTASPVGPLPGPVPGGTPVLQPLVTGREPSPEQMAAALPGAAPAGVESDHLSAEDEPSGEDEPAPPPPNEGWYAVLDDGREVPVTRLILIGRNPQPRAGEEDAVLVKVVDEARTVSKTHLALTVDSRGVLVTDRGSTNGTAVTDRYGIYRLLTAHEPMRLPTEGYLVSFGRHQLRIVRH